MRGEGAADTVTERLRLEARAWLAEHCTDRYRGLEFRGDASGDWLVRMREWNALLADHGWAGIDWPVDYGGRGAGLAEVVALDEEMDAALAPGPLNPIGLANIAPSIMAFGTDEQKRRFLRPMLRGDEIWSQGFSEPDAGSDLASLRCTAVRDGDHYVVTGQKVWNTLGQAAAWCELLVRTDPSAARHAGLSVLLVDLTLPGIEIRPLRTITGDDEFCELFFAGVRVPLDALLGDEGAGWTVAMATLSFERSGVATLHLGLRRRIRELIELARTNRTATDPRVRQRLADLHSAGERLRYLSERAIERSIAGLAPGPESSLIKIAWSLCGQQLAETAAAVLGPESLVDPWARSLLASRSLTIAGGTTEVNRNITGERVLGLPR